VLAECGSERDGVGVIIGNFDRPRIRSTSGAESIRDQVPKERPGRDRLRSELTHEPEMGDG